jgi:hypothetical protein
VNWVRSYAGSAYHQMVGLVAVLTAEGGLPPRKLWPRYDSDLLPLPSDPFQEDSDLRVSVIIEERPHEAP